MSTFAWIHGAVVDADQPLLSPLDRGFTVGGGVFETCSVVQGRPFAMRRHLERLVQSACVVGLSQPPVATIRDAADELLERLGAANARLRITWTAGTGSVGSLRGAGEPTLVIIATPAADVTAGSAAEPAPVDLVQAPWARHEGSPLAGVKSTSYLENVMAMDHARRHGGTEAVLGNTRGELCEGSASNIFVERDGVLLTPPLTSGCLAGVTRELVLEWGRAAGLSVEEATIAITDLTAERHVAVTSSSRGIVPVRSIDGRRLDPGPLTLRMTEVFAARFTENDDP